MWNVRGSLVITFFSAYLLSGCSLAPNGPTNRIRISLPGGFSQAKDARKASNLFAGIQGLERIQAMLGISTLQAGNILPYGLPTTLPFTTPSSPTGFQCFGINVTGPGIIPPASLPKDSCVPAVMPGSGIYGGLVYSAIGGEIEVDVPPGPDRVIQVFGIQTDGYCPSLPEITSQPLGMHPFQYAYELGRSKVDVVDDATVTVAIHSNSSGAPRMFCDSGATSSTLAHQWTRQVGAVDATLSAAGIAVDSSSNVFMVGTTNSAIDFGLQGGAQDFYVTKYDSTGTNLWTRQLGVTSITTQGTGVSVDSSGNAYVVGSVNGGLDGNNLIGTQDSFITKYNPSGTRLWTRQQGVALKATYGRGIAVDSSGYIYVAGYTNGGLESNTLTGVQDFYVTKYDSSGTRLWTRQLGAASTMTYLQGISVDPSDNIYVSGYTNGGLDGNTKSGIQDFFVTKYDSTGVKQWTRQLGVMSNYTWGNSVSTDSLGHVYVAGYTTGALDGNAMTGTYDSFVTKFDSTGTKLWTRLLGVASSSTFTNGISVDSSGNAYIAGTVSAGLDGQTLHGITDYFITKYKPNGLREWTIQNGAAGAGVNGNCIAVDSHSHVYVGGTTDYGIDGLPALGVKAGFFSKY